MAIEQILIKQFGPIKKARGKSGTEYIVVCPFCKKKYKCYININKGVYHCFRCGEKGALSSLIDNFDTDIKVNQIVIGRVQNTANNTNEDLQMPGDLVPLIDLDENHPAVRYIKSRNFDIYELHELYGVRYCINGKQFARLYDTTNTIIFPIWFNNTLIGWQSRLLYNPDTVPVEDYEKLNFCKDNDGEWCIPPKYWTSPGLKKGQILYNYDWARKSNIVVVTEGVFDAIAVGRCAVATFGKAVTEYQTQLLGSFWDLVIILLDPDAEQEKVKLQATLCTMVPTLKVDLVGYKDAGETPRSIIWEQIEKAAIRRNINLKEYNYII